MESQEGFSRSITFCYLCVQKSCWWHDSVTVSKLIRLSLPDPFFPRTSLWAVALAVVLSVLGFLIFPAIYYSWMQHRGKGKVIGGDSLGETVSAERNAANGAILYLSLMNPNLFLVSDKNYIKLEVRLGVCICNSKVNVLCIPETNITSLTNSAGRNPKQAKVWKHTVRPSKRS